MLINSKVSRIPDPSSPEAKCFTFIGLVTRTWIDGRRAGSDAEDSSLARAAVEPKHGARMGVSQFSSH